MWTRALLTDFIHSVFTVLIVKALYEAQVILRCGIGTLRVGRRRVFSATGK
ncbi:MAG: hypothetical protein JNN29_08175 [Chitinophagaceae bacterium]|nr:hypothetical protein [Chitinophagaceae bacterium]